MNINVPDKYKINIVEFSFSAQDRVGERVLKRFLSWPATS